MYKYNNKLMKCTGIDIFLRNVFYKEDAKQRWFFLFLTKILIMTDLSQQDWAQMAKEDANGLIIDVRTDMELEEGKISNAIQCNIQNSVRFMEDVKRFDPNKNYYVYCRSGARSAQACMIMNASGIANTFNLVGGVMNWTGDLVVD